MFYVETVARRKGYPLDILPASSLIGRVPTVNWVTHTQDTDIKRPSLLDGLTAPACVCQNEEIAHL